MPTYEYACTSCGVHHDVVQSFHDDPLTTCPDCGGGLRKVFGSIGVVFKGSGFYKTDSRPTATNGETPSATSPEPKSSDSQAGAKTPESTKSDSTASESSATSAKKGADKKPPGDSSKASSGTGKAAAS